MKRESTDNRALPIASQRALDQPGPQSPPCSGVAVLLRRLGENVALHHDDTASNEKRFGLLHLCFSLSRLGFKSSDDSLCPTGLVSGGNKRRAAGSGLKAAHYVCVLTEGFHHSSECIDASVLVRYLDGVCSHV